MRKRSPEDFRAISLEYAQRACPTKPAQAAKREPKPYKSYKKYILSETWRSLKKTIVAMRGRYCQRCQDWGPVQLHHKTYERLFNERYEDVELLCSTCHRNEHGVKYNPSRHEPRVVHKPYGQIIAERTKANTTRRERNAELKAMAQKIIDSRKGTR